MSGLVNGNAALFLFSHHLRLLLQSADDAVYGIEEVLLAHGLTVVSCGNQCGLVAHVGNVGT